MKSTTYALIAVAAIAAFALLREHWSHVAGYWPYLLLLLCPLMHLFHGHGGMEIINITEVKTIKKLSGRRDRVAVPLSVRIVQSLACAKACCSSLLSAGAAVRNASELTGLLLMTSS